MRISKGTWVTVQKAGTVYRGQLTLDYDSVGRPDVQLTGDGPLGYWHLMAPVEVFYVGSES